MGPSMIPMKRMTVSDLLRMGHSIPYQNRIYYLVNHHQEQTSAEKNTVAISGWRRELALVPNHSKPVSFRSDRRNPFEMVPLTDLAVLSFDWIPIQRREYSVFEGETCHSWRGKRK